MHHQFYDSEEESEPRITPKPVSKLDHFAVPTVPEVSLIFEKPRTEERNDRSIDPSSVRPTKTIRSLDGTIKTSTSPSWSNHDSFAHWREQSYCRAATSTSTTPSSSSHAHKNGIYNRVVTCNHALYSQEQDKTRDKQKKLTNSRMGGTSDGTSEKSVKFQCSNVDDPYNGEQMTRSSASKGQLSCTSLQRATRSITDRCASDNVIPDRALKQSEHLQAPYSRYHPQFCLPGYANYGVDNNETVKTLLQLVNSQSEQIRNLQQQIDRLVRMQEESFRNKSSCACHSPSLVANQVLGYPSMNYYDATYTQQPRQGAKEDVGCAPQSTSVVEKEDPVTVTVDESDKLVEPVPLERQASKKAFMEQKVSIGVMTSFEFTVQNSPFLMESEVYEKKEAPPRENNSKVNARNVNLNVHDASESAKRYKSTFARKPGTAQLENIVEDSESHLSSSQQQSSNFNASSVRDFDRHTPRQSDLYNATSVLESSKLCQRPARDFSRERMYEEVCAEKIAGGSMNGRLQDARQISDYSCIGSANYSKAPVVSDTDGCSAIYGEEGEGKVTTDARSSSHAFNLHSSATDCYQGHKTKEHCAKELKDVGDSMILSGGDLGVLERPPPTPEPSIHVEMQEYTSDDESDRLKRTSKLGWTFYNNVLGQVNDILQNSSIIKDKDENNAKVGHRVEQENDVEAKTALDTVRVATLEQLRRLGISLTENNEHREPNGNNKTLDFDSSFYPRLDRQANMIHASSVVNDTNTSMHMKALALKYLSDEQLADIALHKQESSSLKHVLLSNMEGTNMSFATMRYLERYQLLPGKNNVQGDGADRVHGEVPLKVDFKPAVGKNGPALRRFPFVQTPGTNCPNTVIRLVQIVVFQESCRDHCPQPTDQFKPYPRIKEDAGANVTLHCKGVNMLIIKHNPGIYVIEQGTNVDTWGAATVSNGGLSTFSNLTADTLYRYRLYRITQHGVSSAETSEWFSTFAVDYQPRKVERVSLGNVKEESTNVCKLRAEIIFEPAEDRSCNYDVLSWSGEHNLVNFHLKMSSDFRFFLRHLRYDENNTVSITSANDDNDSKVSNTTTFTFVTPSCLEMHRNLSICAPEKVRGLRVELTQKRKGSYDVAVGWNRPTLQPDNYTLQIDSLQSEPRLLVVPGDAIEAFFSNVNVGPRYEIGIVAESVGGVSLQSTVSANIDKAAAKQTTSSSYHEIIVALPTLMIIAAVFGVICLQHRNRKTRQVNMEYMHFEDSTSDSLKKPLKRDYTAENAETLLPHDKFQLCPEQLKLKGILGSGAYGIVRLASLQDEFGTVTDVAVKMMKDDPTVEDIKNFHQEISMMKSAGQHPNIVSLIGYCTLYNKPLLVVEYCSKGDLQTYLRTIWQNLVNAVFERRTRVMFDPGSFAGVGRNEGESESYGKNAHIIANRLYDIQQEVIKYTCENVTSADLLNFARQVATGMEFLSSNRIVHRDLAARNVLVRPDRVVKISDFGLSRDIYQENVYRKKGNGKLPLKWMAIEALTHQIYTTYSDVWAFGILLWEIVTLGAMPYPGTPTNRILQLLKSGYRMERPTNCSRELYSIMYSCWNQRPQSRPTFAELRQSLDKLLSNYSENKYLNLCEVLQESESDEIDID
ncbi:Fibroblast growth factor receptor [Ooceraea biroi]|uniref:receptor protein-tyrosine kinase n=1 Tax=Ooceraea biroi TaxID=2015173 RepID=A0A026WQS4_OOCBI|nr:Fibroblast growth factor receptor [Ooceraea biroi]